MRAALSFHVVFSARLIVGRNCCACLGTVLRGAACQCLHWIPACGEPLGCRGCSHTGGTEQPCTGRIIHQRFYIGYKRYHRYSYVYQLPCKSQGCFVFWEIVAALTIDLNAMDFFEDEDSMDQALHQLKMLNLGAWRQKCWSSITYCFPVSLLLTAGISSEHELNPSLFSCLMRFRFNIPARSRLAFIPGISWISPSSLQSRAQSCKITFLQSECCHFELPDREKRSISTSLLSLL